MQRYRWPEFEVRLLGELQRQQNNAQFCDTLLQTEGISVPAHSCVLAALSPYLSQKLSASPSPPPSGQKRRLQFQAVKAQTLLKLVSLLYSGELEVTGSVERNDVLSTAFQFGITGLLEGQKDGGMKEGGLQKESFGSCRETEEGRERNVSRTMQDAQVQMTGRRDTDSPSEKRSYVSTGTQTVKAGEKTVGHYFTHSDQTKPPTPEPASSLSQSLDFFTILQPQNITHEKHVCSTSFPPIPSMPGGAPGDGESALDRSSDSVTNPESNSGLPSNAMTFPIFLNAEPNSSTPREDITYQWPSGFGDNVRALAKEGTGLEDGKMADKRENRQQPIHASRDERLGEEKRNSAGKRHARANVGRKSLAKMKQMQQMMETTQISIKVKLRRRTKGEVWEVVSVQDTDETLSLLTSRKQDGSNHKRPQTDLTNGQPPPSSVQPGPVHKGILQPPNPRTTSEFTPNRNDGPELVPLAQPPCPAEESDEQIEKLLEDIMMGLNILPDLEGDCKKSHRRPSHDGAPSVCQVLVEENDRAQSPVHAPVSAEGCVCYQHFGTRSGDSTDAGIHCCFPAQNLLGCSSLSSALIQRQQRSVSPQYPSPVTSVVQRDGTSHQDMPQSKSQNCPYPEAPTTKSVIPIAFYSSGQKLHYPVCQDSSSQDDQNILDFLLLTNGNEAQSSHSFSSPCMDDLRLPRCLSPLEPSTSAAKYHPVLSNSTHHSDKIQPQPSLQGRPWLMEIPGSLQFPLDAITHRDNIHASSPQDSNRSCWSKQQRLNPQNVGTWLESCTVKDRGTIPAGHQNTAELKSDPRKVKESSTCKQGDAAAPKSRRRPPTNEHGLSSPAACSLLAYQDVKVDDGTKSKSISLSLCTVSLSSNNVLAKEREMAISSSNTPNRFVGSTSKPSLTITESLREKTSGPEDLTSDQTRIRTRGFLKKTQETPSNTSLDEASVLKPVARRDEAVLKQEVSVPKRKRGRPPKAKLQKSLPESSPAIIETKNHRVESEQQIDNNLPKEEEEGENTKRRCKRRRRNRSDMQAIPPRKTTSVENTDEAEADHNNDIMPAGRKRPCVVTLKEFQKFIDSQHSKTRRSKESQDKDANETTRDSEELIKCTEVDKEVTPSPNRDRTRESRFVSGVAVDENHNQIFNKSTAECSKPQPGATDRSTSKDTSLLGGEYHPVRSLDVCGEEVSKLPPEVEQPLKSPDGAQRSCDAGMSVTVRHIVDGSRPSCDAHLPQQDKMTSDQNLNPQPPERTGPLLSDAVEFSKSSGCDQEEEEEMEVDILLCSPDNVPQTRECDKGLDGMDMTPEEEEEEEDVSEIDVTGE